MIFLMSFIREFLSMMKSKLQIAQKDTLSAIVIFFTIGIGELMTPIVLGISFNQGMLLRIFGVASAGFIASIISSKVVNKVLAKHKQDKPYQFTIKFRTLDICEFVDMQLKEQGIKTYINRNNKTLKAFSLNKEHSKIILDCIEGRFKNYSINEFKDYVKAPKINQNN